MFLTTSCFSLHPIRCIVCIAWLLQVLGFMFLDIGGRVALNEAGEFSNIKVMHGLGFGINGLKEGKQPPIINIVKP